MPRSAVSWRFFPVQHPAPLLQDRIDPAVESAGGLLDVGAADHDLLGGELHFSHDAFPLGNFRRGPDALQLLAKRPGAYVAGELFLPPWCAPGRKICAQRVEANLYRGFGKI